MRIVITLAALLVLASCGSAASTAFDPGATPSSDMELCQTVLAFEKVRPRDTTAHVEAYGVIFGWMDTTGAALAGTERGEMLAKKQILLEATVPGRVNQLEDMSPEELVNFVDEATQEYIGFCGRYDVPSNDLYKQVYAYILNESGLAPYQIASVEPNL